MVATVAGLKARYAIFAPVTDETVQLFLDDALPYVTAFEADADRGQMFKAAHDMIVSKVQGIIKDAAEQLPAGVTKFKSASMDVAVSETAANRSLLSGYASTWFGEQFAKLDRRYNGMPRLVGFVEPCGICRS